MVLLVMYFWLSRLGRLMGIISSYLSERELSAWEGHYRKFSKLRSGKESQQATMALVFIVLGIFGAALPCLLVIGSSLVVSWSGWWLALSASLLVYLLLVVRLAFSRWRTVEHSELWRKVLAG